MAKQDNWANSPARRIACIAAALVALSRCAGGRSEPRASFQDTGGDSVVVQAQLAMKEGPLPLVLLLARWDTAGHWTCSGCEPEYDRARAMMVCWIPDESCLTDEPGWDVTHIVRGYTARLLSRSDTLAQVEVVYDRVAMVSAGRLLESPDHVLTWRATVQRGPQGWRLVSPSSQKAPCVSIGVALRKVLRDASDRSKLQALLLSKSSP